MPDLSAKPSVSQPLWPFLPACSTPQMTWRSPWVDHMAMYSGNILTLIHHPQLSADRRCATSVWRDTV